VADFGSKGIQINRDFSASVRLSHHRHRLVRTDVQYGVDGSGGNRADLQADAFLRPGQFSVGHISIFNCRRYRVTADVKSASARSVKGETFGSYPPSANADFVVRYKSDPFVSPK